MQNTQKGRFFLCTTELRGALIEAKEAMDGKRKLNTLDRLIEELREYTKGTVLFVYETDWRELRVHKRDGSFCVQTTSYFDSWRLRKRKPKKTKKAKK